MFLRSIGPFYMFHTPRKPLPSRCEPLTFLSLSLSISLFLSLSLSLFSFSLSFSLSFLSFALSLFPSCSFFRSFFCAWVSRPPPPSSSGLPRELKGKGGKPSCHPDIYTLLPRALNTVKSVCLSLSLYLSLALPLSRSLALSSLRFRPDAN